jgi:hypothetical protein
MRHTPATISVHSTTRLLHQVYKQRVKHLLFEHQNETTVKKADAQVALSMSQGEHRWGCVTSLALCTGPRVLSVRCCCLLSGLASVS